MSTVPASAISASTSARVLSLALLSSTSIPLRTKRSLMARPM